MIPQGLSATAFWDVSFPDINFEQQSVFVMERVYNYGKWDDYKALQQFYGAERIKEEIVQANYLDKKTLAFLCLIFDLKKEDFKCFLKKQSRPLYGDF